MRKKLDPNAPCFLYNIVDCNGQVVYVGITNNPKVREGQHKNSKKGIIKRFQCLACNLKFLVMKKFSNRKKCKVAETLEIKMFNPIFNDGESDVPPVQQWEEQEKWKVKNCGFACTPYSPLIPAA
nr:GIY-YIG nuclease family protein [Marinobacterium ramblicola]